MSSLNPPALTSGILVFLVLLIQDVKLKSTRSYERDQDGTFLALPVAMLKSTRSYERDLETLHGDVTGLHA